MQISTDLGFEGVEGREGDTRMWGESNYGFHEWPCCQAPPVLVAVFRHEVAGGRLGSWWLLSFFGVNSKP